MSGFLRWPYDEVSISLSPDEKTASVTAPWLAATFQIPEGYSPQVRLLSEKIKSASLTQSDLRLVDHFFREFSAYPFSYILPTPKTEPNLDCHFLKVPSIDTQTPQALLESVVAQSQEAESGLGTEEISGLICRLPRTRWSWDWTAASAFTKIQNKIHPESLFSVARRFHLLDTLSLNEGTNIFEQIKSLKGEPFKKAAALMVRQNHFVTQKCRDCLLPAVRMANSAQTKVESFIQQENGHDRILEKAMSALTEEPCQIAVSIETKTLLRLLKFVAGHNFLAFSLAVDCFERNTYEKTDPLAQLLVSGGFPEAAKQINLHYQINDQGEHENIALGFLQFMAPCDEAYALEAFRLAELISLLMIRIPSSAIQLANL